MSDRERPGALLMTYGSPSSLDTDAIRAYLTRVRGGRAPEDDLVDEFVRRYRAIGGSPLVGITRAQAAALAESLGWPVEVGMRFSEPSIVSGLRALADAGVSRVAAITLSPQHSPLLMGGYARAIDEALETLGDGAPEVVVAGAWHRTPALIAGLARLLNEAIDRMPDAQRRALHVLMTAHSIPKRVADAEPDYVAQLRDTAEAVAAKASLGPREWTFCWQSAGHEPGEWMRPDFADLMPRLAVSGTVAVLAVPVQFLSDHLETLYDIDIAARQQAEASGLAFRRIESPGIAAELIEALDAVARATLRRTAPEEAEGLRSAGL